MADPLNPRKLRALLAALRPFGVVHFKHGDLEMVIQPARVPVGAAKQLDDTEAPLGPYGEMAKELGIKMPSAKAGA